MNTNKSAFNKNWICTLRRLVILLLGLSAFALMSGCADETVPADVVGYNHMSKKGILGFSINGSGGDILFPNGQGGDSCCAEIPIHWHPGLMAHVEWQPSSGASQEATVEIQEYKPDNLGPLQVHFYPDNRVKVIVSMSYIENPCYPMSEADKAPWKTDNNLIELFTTGKGKDQPCERREELLKELHKGAAQ